MNEGPRIRKIHFDSRMRVSGGTSNPVFGLAENVELPENTVAMVDNVAIPHSFGTINDSIRYLYLAERGGAAAPYTYNVRKLDLVAAAGHLGTYNASTLKGVLDTALAANPPQFVQTAYTTVAVLATNKIVMTPPANVLAHWPIL